MAAPIRSTTSGVETILPSTSIVEVQEKRKEVSWRLAPFGRSATSTKQSILPDGLMNWKFTLYSP